MSYIFIRIHNYCLVISKTACELEAMALPRSGTPQNGYPSPASTRARDPAEGFELGTSSTNNQRKSDDSINTINSVYVYTYIYIYVYMCITSRYYVYLCVCICIYRWETYNDIRI